MQDMNVKLYQIETRLQELVRVVNKLTGFVPVVLTWEKPEFDEFSEPLSYRINVDDHSYQDPLPLETTQHSLKVWPLMLSLISTSIVTYRSILFCVQVISSTLVLRKERNTPHFATIEVENWLKTIIGIIRKKPD
jgi:ubiquinone/menaquinone biosynthesis C-methylase UbiE